MTKQRFKVRARFNGFVTVWPFFYDVVDLHENRYVPLIKFRTACLLERRLNDGHYVVGLPWATE